MQPGARMYAQTFACVRMCALSTLSMQLYHTVSGSASLHVHLHLCMHAFELIFFARGHACVRKSKHLHACFVTAFV